MRIIAIGFLLGCMGLQSLAVLPPWPGCFLLLVLIPIAVYWPRTRLMAAAACGFLWALLIAQWGLSQRLPAHLEGIDLVLEGYIASVPEPGERGVRFLFDAELMHEGDARVAVPYRLRLSWYAPTPELLVGERWRLPVRLKRPYGFMNPGGLDYEAWLYQQGIAGTGYVRHKLKPLRLDSGSGVYAVGRIRQALGVRIAKVLGDSSYTGVLTALVIGEQSGVSRAQWEVFARTGTTHLVAISGLHITMIAGLVFFAARRLWTWFPGLALRLPAPKAAALAALSAALGYALLAGFSIPTRRALIMVAVVMGAIWWQRHTAISHILAIALLLVLVAEPTAVLAPGFWLSYAAVGVILFGTLGRLAVPRWPRPARRRMDSAVRTQTNGVGVSTSLRAAGNWLGWHWGRTQALVTIGLMPLTLLWFQRASIIALLANLIAIPWISFLVVPPALLGTLLLPFAESIGGVLLGLAEKLLDFIWPFLHLCSAWPYAQWTQPTPPVWALVAAGIGVSVLLAPRGLPGRWLGMIFLLPTLLIDSPSLKFGEVRMTLLDVGQGLSAVIHTKSHTLVFDAGARSSPSFDSGKLVVLPYLYEMGVRRLDGLLISHDDNDHIGGADAILDAVPVQHVITSVTQAFQHPSVKSCAAGLHWRWDGVEFRILHPARAPLPTSSDNNNSCVLRVRTADGTILLTGDIEKAVETRLIDEQPDMLAADILIVPHHGSKTSSSPAFVSAVNPRFALFAAGYRNRYGHPKPEVVARYQQLPAHVYNSARHGAISFTIVPGMGIAPPHTWRQSARRYWHTQ